MNEMNFEDAMRLDALEFSRRLNQLIDRTALPATGSKEVQRHLREARRQVKLGRDPEKEILSAFQESLPDHETVVHSESRRLEQFYVLKKLNQLTNSQLPAIAGDIDMNISSHIEKLWESSERNRVISSHFIHRILQTGYTLEGTAHWIELESFLLRKAAFSGLDVDSLMRAMNGFQEQLIQLRHLALSRWAQDRAIEDLEVKLGAGFEIRAVSALEFFGQHGLEREDLARLSSCDFSGIVQDASGSFKVTRATEMPERLLVTLDEVCAALRSPSRDSCRELFCQRHPASRNGCSALLLDCSLYELRRSAEIGLQKSQEPEIEASMTLPDHQQARKERSRV